MWHLHVNSVKTDFSSFLPPFTYILFWNSPQVFSKIGENAFGAHFLQRYRKNEYGDPYFLFHDFNEDSTSFRCEKKMAQIYVQFFANFTWLSYHGSKSACPI